MLLAQTQPEIDGSRPKAAQIFDLLRTQIIHDRLHPGDRMSEADIARRFDVSRQPVREAFIKLAEQGLVQVKPKYGTIISPIGYAALLDAEFLREAVESDIARLLAEAPDPGLLADLRAQIDVQEAIGSDPERFFEADDVFHRTLAEAAGKASAWGLIEGLKSRMDRVRYLDRARFPPERVVGQHRVLVDAIAAGLPITADAAMRVHLRDLLEQLPTIVAEHRGHFELPEGQLPDPVSVPLAQGRRR